MMKSLARVIGFLVLAAFATEIVEPSSIFVRIAPSEAKVHFLIEASPAQPISAQLVSATPSVRGPADFQCVYEHSATAVEFFHFASPRLLAVRFHFQARAVTQLLRSQLYEPPISS